MPTLQSNGGAALGIRSNDSFDDEDIWLLVCTSVFWVPVALVLLVVICCLLMDLGLLCWHICKKLARGICWVAFRMNIWLMELLRLASVRKAASQVTSNEQQTTTESIEMGYMRSDSSEPPPDYELYRPLEEPLPVYKLSENCDLV